MYIKATKKITELILEGVYKKKISIFSKALILDITELLNKIHRWNSRPPPCRTVKVYRGREKDFQDDETYIIRGKAAELISSIISN